MKQWFHVGIAAAQHALPQYLSLSSRLGRFCVKVAGTNSMNYSALLYQYKSHLSFLPAPVPPTYD